MNIQTIFKTGNSNVVALPKDYLEALNVQTGDKVVIEKVPESEALLIAPAKKQTTKSAVSAEFKHWLSQFLKEDGAILDELADR